MDVLHIEEGEHVILIVRKHWWILLRDSFATLVAGVAPFILFGVISFAPLAPQISLTNSLVVFGASLWCLLVWLTLAVIWTNYYLDMWILTSRRMFNIEQIGLFDRRVATWNLDRVQQITVSHAHILETLLGYGTITVETAGPADEALTAHGIPNPEVLRTRILHYAGVSAQGRSLARPAHLG